MPNGMVPVEMLYRAVRNMLEFPLPQICRHLVALELLDIIEAHGGVSIDEQLVKYIVKASECDEEAIARMDELGIGLKPNGKENA